MPLRGTNFRGPLIAAAPQKIAPAATSHRLSVAAGASRRAYDFVMTCVVPHL